MEYIQDVFNSGHICVRELLKIFIPGRWQSAEILEDICRHYGHERLHLQGFAVEKLFPGIHESTISVSSLARGSWSAPATDQMMLAKLARLTQPEHVLEIGSFRGYTARLLAENTSSDCVIHALDTNPHHGEAYLNSSLTSRIVRHFGSLADSFPESLKGISFDLIFIDADHKFEAVEKDTKEIIPFLAERGLLLWHDYSDWGWMSAWNRVPEFLRDLSREIPVLSIPGTTLAIHRRGWTDREVAKAVEDWNNSPTRSQWDSEVLKGEL